jgi:hypothetical protein
MSTIRDYIIFTFFSSIEYIAALVFIFTVFRIRFRWYDPRIFFICVSMSYASYTMRMQEESDILAGIVQLLLMIVFIWLLLQFHIFYAAIMSVTTYFAYGLIQTLIIIVCHELKLIRIEEMQLLSWQNHTIASITATVSLLISYWIRRRNWGFSFVPDGDRIRVNYLKKENLFLLLIIVAAIITSGFMYYLVFTFENAHFFIILNIVFFIALSYYSYIMYKKDRKEANNDD